MARVRVHNVTMSVDGYSAGPRQGPDTPLGEGGERLHEWMFQTRFGRTMLGQEGGTTGIDDERAQAFGQGIGATIMGRNMFGPIRGPWPDEQWRGWWGENPPYHHDVFVLTHHPRDPIQMKGGTTFHFVTDGPEVALDRARQAAGERDVAIAGGVSTLRTYLRAALIDEVHVVIAPILLAAGERLFDDLPDLSRRYRVQDVARGDVAVHVRLVRAGD